MSMKLDAHLRDQMADLSEAGLSDDEAFLVGVKRMGDVDRLSREFAREHSDRLWKQLVPSVPAEQEHPSTGLSEALLLAVAAAVAIQVARLAAGWPGEETAWLLRNVSLLVFPFLAGYFIVRRRLPLREIAVTLAPFVLAGLVTNLYPYDPNSSTEPLVMLHLPVALWFVVMYAYMDGTWRSHERRMDFVRLTGEWFIYYVLTALGGGVLLGNLTGAAWLSMRFLTGRTAFPRLERWQTAYLPVFAVWAVVVVLLLPPLFSFA